MPPVSVVTLADAAGVCDEIGRFVMRLADVAGICRPCMLLVCTVCGRVQLPEAQPAGDASPCLLASDICAQLSTAAPPHQPPSQ